MIKLSLDISQSTENEALVSEINAPNSSGGMSPLNKISVANSYMKFTNKAVDVLRALGANKRFFYSHSIIKLGEKLGETSAITIHTIKYREEVKDLFEPLRRIGINLSELKVGISQDTNNLYVSNKILRDISKFDTSIQQELAMYLSSIAYFFTGIVSEIPKIMTIYGNQLEVNITDWSKYILSFQQGMSITLSEIPTDELKAIRYYKNLYSTPDSLSVAKPDNSFIIAEAENQRKLIISRDFDKNIFWVYVPEKNTVYTNDTLTYMNMDYDSFSAGFSQALGSTVDVISNAKLIFDKDKEYGLSTDTEPDTFKYDDNFEKIIKAYNCNTGISKTKLSLLIPNCKAVGNLVDKDTIIQSYANDEYAQQLYTQVQPYYETFDLKTLNSSLKGFANGDIYAMMFIGESGTGKSTSARVIPYRCGIPYISINFCVNIEESDLFGTMIPNPEKSKPEDPEFIWQDGIVTKAVRNGYAVILEELNFARPGVLGKLNSLLDENRQIDLANGEILKAHKNFRMIATCNIAYEGTNRFNKALINRFELIHEFKDLDKREAFKVIKDRVKNVDDSKLGKVYSVYELLKKYGEEQSLDIVVSIRQLFNLFKQGKYYSTAYDAIIDILINGAFVEIPEYKTKFIDSVLDKKTYSFKL